MKQQFEESLGDNVLGLDLTYDTENRCYKNLITEWVYYGWCVGFGEGLK